MDKTAKTKTKYRYHYLLRMPMTEAVTTEEGGLWIPFSKFNGGRVHSIRFVGGHEWDCVNGWRNTELSSTAGARRTCRASNLRDALPSWISVEEVPVDYPVTLPGGFRDAMAAFG